MTKCALVLLTVCLAALAHPCMGKKRLDFQEEWGLWKSEHHKTYRHHHEEARRHATWLANRNAIEEHNDKTDTHGFTLKMNHMGDLVII